MLEERMTVPGTSLGAMIEAISALEDAVFGVSHLCIYIPPVCVHELQWRREH